MIQSYDFKKWTPSQWKDLDILLCKPVNQDIEQAVLEGFGYIEPSEWDDAIKQLRPWINIASLYVEIAKLEKVQSQYFVGFVQKYVPVREDVKHMVSAMLNTVFNSLDVNHTAIQNWNLLMSQINPNADTDSHALGEWSL